MPAERDHDLAAGLLGGGEEPVVGVPVAFAVGRLAPAQFRPPAADAHAVELQGAGFAAVRAGSIIWPSPKIGMFSSGRPRAAWARGRPWPGTAASGRASAPGHRCRTGPAPAGPAPRRPSRAASPKRTVSGCVIGLPSRPISGALPPVSVKASLIRASGSRVVISWISMAKSFTSPWSCPWRTPA